MVNRELSKGQRLLTEELLIGLRAETVQRRVTATPIVERLSVEEHIRLHLVAGVVHTGNLAVVVAKLSITGKLVIITVYLVQEEKR